MIRKFGESIEDIKKILRFVLLQSQYEVVPKKSHDDTMKSSSRETQTTQFQDEQVDVPYILGEKKKGGDEESMSMDVVEETHNPSLDATKTHMKGAILAKTEAKKVVEKEVEEKKETNSKSRDIVGEMKEPLEKYKHEIFGLEFVQGLIYFVSLLLCL